MSHLPLSDEERKRVILRELGQEENAESRAQVDAYWMRYSATAAIYPLLLDLYVERDLIKHLIGNSLGLIDWKWDAVQQSNSQYLDGLFKLWEAVLEQIKLLQAQIGSTRAAQVGLITATAPSPPPWGVDANAARYRGSPYYRTGGCW